MAAGARQREANSFEVGDRETETPPERSRLQSNSDDAIACSCIRRHLIALALSCQRHYISRPTDLSLSREREETLSEAHLVSSPSSTLDRAETNFSTAKRRYTGAWYHQLVMYDLPPESAIKNRSRHLSIVWRILANDDVVPRDRFLMDWDRRRASWECRNIKIIDRLSNVEFLHTSNMFCFNIIATSENLL